jgi:hypothetical protein
MNSKMFPNPATAGGKTGMSSVNPSSKGHNPAANSAGTPGRSFPADPIPGPMSTGGPISLKRALAKKSMPRMGRDAPGTR